MNISFVFLLGLLVAFIGVVPPGLLNLTAAKISLKEGYPRGFIFSLGAEDLTDFNKNNMEFEKLLINEFKIQSNIYI